MVVVPPFFCLCTRSHFSVVVPCPRPSRATIHVSQKVREGWLCAGLWRQNRHSGGVKAVQKFLVHDRLLPRRSRFCLFFLVSFVSFFSARKYSFKFDPSNGISLTLMRFCSLSRKLDKSLCKGLFLTELSPPSSFDWLINCATFETIRKF